MPGGMPDPEALKAAMADPAVQKQVAEMSAAMENEKVQKRFEELRVRRLRRVDSYPVAARERKKGARKRRGRELRGRMRITQTPPLSLPPTLTDFAPPPSSFLFYPLATEKKKKKKNYL